MAHSTIRFGIPDDKYLRPLFETMKEFCRQRAEKSPEYSGLSFVTVNDAVERLLNDELDAAVIPVLDYAKNSSDLSLYPGFAISSIGESGIVRLLTRSDIKTIARVALGPVAAQDAVLAKIILSEQFEQDVEFVSMQGDIPGLLQTADAVVVGGDAALGIDVESPAVDLAAEWIEMAELPFVHLVCAGKKWTENAQLATLLTGMDTGDDLLPEEMGFGFTDLERNGLGEFFRYAFYLGILPDVPEIEVFEGSGQAS